jgi:hypothetical protein
MFLHDGNKISTYPVAVNNGYDEVFLVFEFQLGLPVKYILCFAGYIIDNCYYFFSKLRTTASNLKTMPEALSF